MIWNGKPLIHPNESGWHMIRWYYPDKKNYIDMPGFWSPLENDARISQWRFYSLGGIDVCYASSITKMSNKSDRPPEYIGKLILFEYK